MSAAEEHLTGHENPLQVIRTFNNLQHQQAKHQPYSAPGSPASSRHAACQLSSSHQVRSTQSCCMGYRRESMLRQSEDHSQPRSTGLCCSSVRHLTAARVACQLVPREGPTAVLYASESATQPDAMPADHSGVRLSERKQSITQAHRGGAAEAKGLDLSHIGRILRHEAGEKDVEMEYLQSAQESRRLVQAFAITQARSGGCC